jgi:hypothetical protein
MVDFKGFSLCINDVHKSGMKYGYARVSTDGQSLDAQVKQLRADAGDETLAEIGRSYNVSGWTIAGLPKCGQAATCGGFTECLVHRGHHFCYGRWRIAFDTSTEFPVAPMRNPMANTQHILEAANARPNPDLVLL